MNQITKTPDSTEVGMMYLVRFSNYQSHLRSASVTLAVLRPVSIQLELLSMFLLVSRQDS